MKGKNHLIIAAFIFMLLDGYVEEVKLGDIALLIMFTLIPDTDIKFGSHRNILFHSILIPALTLFGDFGVLEILLILSVGIHLLCDVRFPYMEKDKKTDEYEWNKPGGFYLIKMGRKRMTYLQTNAWLIGNGLLSIGLFIAWVIIK